MMERGDERELMMEEMNGQPCRGVDGSCLYSQDERGGGRGQERSPKRHCCCCCCHCCLAACGRGIAGEGRGHHCTDYAWIRAMLGRCHESMRRRGMNLVEIMVRSAVCCAVSSPSAGKVSARSFPQPVQGKQGAGSRVLCSQCRGPFAVDCGCCCGREEGEGEGGPSPRSSPVSGEGGKGPSGGGALHRWNSSLSGVHTVPITPAASISEATGAAVSSQHSLSNTPSYIRSYSCTYIVLMKWGNGKRRRSVSQ